MKGILAASNVSLTLTLSLLLVASGVGWAAVSENLLKNPSFEKGQAKSGAPVSWSRYAGGDKGLVLRLVSTAHTGKKALLIHDDHPGKEVGVSQDAKAEPGLTYEASVYVRGVPGASTGGSYLQMRFAPSGKYAQKGLAATGLEEFDLVSVRATAPAGTKTVRVYLYTHRDPTPKVIVDSVSLVSGVEPPPPPPPPPPKPVPPVYNKLKDLHIDTQLVKGGKPNTTIVVPASGMYAAEAARIQQTVEDRTGVRPPIATDDAPEADVPIKGHLIALGNRSTNKTVEKLYNFYYTLLDLRYPGAGGSVVRTLHSPFGDGHNVVLVGGSDAAGVQAAADVFVAKLGQAKAERGEMSIGRLMEIELGKGIVVPTDLREYLFWDASKGYRSTGYFGWNSISKHMAMYYMTGRERDAREVIRLSFPDAQARKQLCEIDGERLENKDEPLSGPYHYNAHIMILFWDLIEESPVFTDEERLRVTNAFSKQLDHRKREGIYGRGVPRVVGSRHGQWAAVSHYCLGRYFQKDYPNPIWHHCIQGAINHFGSLHKYVWVGGESDNLFWYNTGIAAIFTHLALTGDRKPVDNGVLRELLRGQEILWSGRRGDWALNSASIGFLHKAAYLMQDGRYIHYREQTGVDTDCFRLGQSFWPEEHLAAKRPDDLPGKWSIQALSKPAWLARHNGFALAESFQFGSYRSAADATGDFILIDGFNGASRNPYHTFAILQLRIDGETLLEGYLNQVLTRADGMVEPRVAMNGALRYRDVIGPTAVAVGEVPDAAYCNWRRTLVQRTGQYALVVDDLTFRTDSDNIEVQLKWQNARGTRSSQREPGVLRLRGAGKGKLPPGWHRTRALDAKCSTNLTDARGTVRLDGINIMLLRSENAGDWIEMPFRLDRKMTGEVLVGFVKYLDRGVVRMLLDREAVGQECDLYAEGAETYEVSLGRRTLAAGEHRLRVQTVSANPQVGRCYVGLSGVTIRPENATSAAVQQAFDVCLSDPVKTTRSGSITTMEWGGGVKNGQHRIFFTAIARNASGPDSRAACARLDDNTAAVALPQPALVAVGNSGRIDGELVVLAEDHLFGKGIRRASFLSASSPVNVDWDFTAGRMHVVADKPSVLKLSLGAGQVLVDGKRSVLNANAEGLFVLPLMAGRHVVEDAKPQPDDLDRLAARLSATLAESRKAREEGKRALVAKAVVKAPPLRAGFAASVGGSVVDLITIPTDGGSSIYAAEGKTVHVLSTEGKETKTLEADGAIRMLRWWPEHELLLVGCRDEQVVAFDRSGQRKWVFTSVMDPAVFRAAKTYWFKTAPGHEGIHGLHTGVFIDGKSQCFVGSACTLEIIDEHGKLIKRMPLFWGKNSHFQIVDAPDGSLNLLAARRYSGVHHVTMVNNRKLVPGPKTFNGVPPGHTYVGGWSSMNRDHLFYVDLDGDGKKEVVSEINGTWNRVTVWDERGKALYDASFGPGRRIMAKNMRDLEVADLDGDGKKEILVATSSGLVVALDCQCRKLWAKRLPSPATVMKAMPRASSPWIVAGCEDGTVMVLDGRGEFVRRDRVNGRPTCIEALDESGVLLATTKGEVKLFAVEP